MSTRIHQYRFYQPRKCTVYNALGWKRCIQETSLLRTMQLHRLKHDGLWCLHKRETISEMCLPLKHSEGTWAAWRWYWPSLKMISICLFLHKRNWGKVPCASTMWVYNSLLVQRMVWPSCQVSPAWLGNLLTGGRAETQAHVLSVAQTCSTHSPRGSKSLIPHNQPP